MKKPFLRAILIITILFLALSACKSNPSSAADAIQAYLQALVSKDSERLSTLACADWEADARIELESFTAVTVALKDLDCQETGKDGDITLVRCSGKIEANYGNEILEIDLTKRAFQTVYEAGEWRMCGYR